MGLADKAKWVEFKPHERNLSKVLGDLEADIMEALWELDPANVKGVHKKVSEKRKVAITTVATVLDRLYEKGLVTRELKKWRGVYYEYKPAITKRQFENTVVRDVLKGLFETFGDSAMSYLVDRMEINDRKKLEEFKRYLRKSVQEGE